jgi:ribosomal protein L34E
MHEDPWLQAMRRREKYVENTGITANKKHSSVSVCLLLSGPLILPYSAFGRNPRLLVTNQIVRFSEDSACNACPGSRLQGMIQYREVDMVIIATKDRVIFQVFGGLVLCSRSIRSKVFVKNSFF